VGQAMLEGRFIPAMCGHACDFGHDDCPVCCCQSVDHDGPHCYDPCQELARCFAPGLCGGGRLRKMAGLPGAARLPLERPSGAGSGRGPDLVRSAIGGSRLPEAPEERPIQATLLCGTPAAGMIWVVVDPVCGLEIRTPVDPPEDLRIVYETSLVCMDSTSYVVRIERMDAAEVTSFKEELV
jgi:hypothetical protein